MVVMAVIVVMVAVMVVLEMPCSCVAKEVYKFISAAVDLFD